MQLKELFERTNISDKLLKKQYIEFGSKESGLTFDEFKLGAKIAQNVPPKEIVANQMRKHLSALEGKKDGNL